jgi:hypothetical protein
MSIKLTIRDELPIGQVAYEISFEVAAERLTARDLIRQRVHQEVALYNLSQPGYFQGLVQPSDAEATLNGYRLRQRRQIDWEKQADLALKAFDANGFFILVDDRQVESLDEMIEIREDTQISFVKLMPLVGG